MRCTIAALCVTALVACAHAPPPDPSVVPGTVGMVVGSAGNRLRVDALRHGGPAERAGIEVGDTVTSYNGVPVRDLRQFRDLVLDSPPGSTAHIVIQRNGAARTVDVPVKELDLEPEA